MQKHRIQYQNATLDETILIIFEPLIFRRVVPHPAPHSKKSKSSTFQRSNRHSWHIPKIQTAPFATTKVQFTIVFLNNERTCHKYIFNITMKLTDSIFFFDQPYINALFHQTTFFLQTSDQ